MKRGQQIFVTLLSCVICVLLSTLPSALSATQAYDRYKKGFDTYFTTRTDDAFDAFWSAYNDLMASKYALPGERLAAGEYFKQKMGSSQSIEDYILAESARRGKSGTQEEVRLKEELERLAQEKEQETLSIEQLKRDVEAAKIALQKQQVETAQQTEQQKAQLNTRINELRMQIRSFLKIPDYDTTPGAKQPLGSGQARKRIDDLLTVYEIADSLSANTKKQQDLTLRKKVSIALWRLFKFYAGADGKLGDAPTKARLRVKIQGMLDRDLVTSVSITPDFRAIGAEAPPTPEELGADLD